MKKIFYNRIYIFSQNPMNDFNKKLFDAIYNKDIEFINNLSYIDCQSIDIELFKDESNDPYYNYIKGTYYDFLAYENEYVKTDKNQLLIDECYEKAGQFYELASKELHNTEIYESLGKIYQHFSNNEKMIYYFELAKTEYAYDCLGEYYENENNYEKSIYYYELSGNKYKVGKLYEEKLKNQSEAIYYYSQASDSNSQLRLGLIYEKQSEFETAKYYYALSAKNQNIKAVYLLGRLYDKKLNDKEKAKYYYELAIKNDHEFACVNLGSLYEAEKKYFDAFYLYCKSGIIGIDYILKMIDNSESFYFISEKIDEYENTINKLKNELEKKNKDIEKLKLELSLIPGYGTEFKLAEERYNNKNYQ